MSFSARFAASANYATTPMLGMQEWLEVGSVGSVRCIAPGRFTGVAVELDGGSRLFTTLPVVPVQR